MGKSYTVAERRRNKIGRPRLAANNNTRETNGKLSRRLNRTEPMAMDVAIDTRIRHLGLVDYRRPDGSWCTAQDQARDPMTGYEMGLMVLNGAITRRQHDAATRYAEDIWRHMRMAGIPFPSAKAQNLFSSRGTRSLFENEDEAYAAGRAKAKAEDINAILLLGQDDDGNRAYSFATGNKIVGAMNEIALQDFAEHHIDPATRKITWRPLVLDLFRLGADVLAKHYRIPA